MKAPLIAASLAILPLAASGAPPTDTRPLPNVVVIDSLPADPAMSAIELPDSSQALGIDGAELIRSLTGVSAGRMGGHGLEAVIRGQSQGQLNVLLDGSFVNGGCPNRMDPPTSFMGVQAYDRITVIKGVQSLRHGPGGSGGTVLFERNTRVPADGFGGDGGLSASSNGVDHAAYADIVAGGQTGFARLSGSRHRADDYEDGDGRQVRSSYTTTGGLLTLGYTPRDDARIELSLETVRTMDALFPGAGMDAPEDKAQIARLKGQTALTAGVRLEGSAWYAGVDHLMDNYSLRPRTAPMAMRVPSDSDTIGGRLMLDIDVPGDWTVTTGLDHQENRRTATRYQGPDETAVGALNSLLWPDVVIRQTGFLAEVVHDAGEASRWRLGARFDHVRADAAATDTDPAGMAASPAALYADYYGAGGAGTGTQNEDNIGLLARYEHDLSRRLTWFAGISRTVRSAESTERYIASDSPMNPAGRWIGNPWLQPERHHQMDAGLVVSGAAWQFNAVAFVDEVSDYILRDRARGQDQVLRSDGASVFRNVDARLLGAEMAGDFRLTPRWTLGADLAYVHADNSTDGRALAQTPPLNGSVRLTFRDGRWETGARWAWAAGQPRSDDDTATGSGLDARQTPGYGVVDLHATLRAGAGGELRVGVGNLFDKTYADHLNRASQDPFNPEPVQVNEPGRSIWANWRSLF